ncbi:hypothetical protein SLA_1504 [Streptomyces laurentii]|uniref:Uncharacterized protein n=1 Tax=Streptomyces laurentii TaxID=39478 RepID=A0A160NXB3_STRLU|nr:hypothetical protein SLA_1504 [Streptomyces laurentii]
MSLSRVVLSSGRSITLAQLRMSSTYGGMPAGYPCKRVNDRKVEALRQEAERAFPSWPVHLIPPTRAYPDESGGGFGPVEVMPAVTCVGFFHSAAIAQGCDWSVLAVAWFQAAPVVPSGEDADLGLRGIPWEELARDDEF